MSDDIEEQLTEKVETRTGYSKNLIEIVLAS